MKYLFKVILALSAVLWATTASSQHFTHLTPNDGLSQHTVLSIAQDPEGMMWFGTMGGLNRYDGYDLTLFAASEEDPGSIADNTIQKVYVDSDGRLWVGTKRGLSMWDSRKEIFLNSPTASAVTDIIEIQPHLLMVSTENELLFYDAAQHCFVSHLLPAATTPMKVISLARKENTVWLGTLNQGLFTYSIEKCELMRSSLLQCKVPIQQILFEPNGERMWVATEGEGLFCLNPNSINAEVAHYGHGSGISSNYVRSLAFDTEGKLWVGTFGGLDIYAAGKITSLKSNPFEKGSLSQNSIRSICCDNQGGMWLGTYFGGVNYFHPMTNHFHHIERQPVSNSLSSNIISCIVEDTDGSLWVGTNSGGVNHLYPSTGRVKHYFTDLNPKEGAESNDIKAIYIDSRRGLVYVGAHAGGLNILNKRTGATWYRTLPGNERLDIYAILPKDDNTLWIGTLNGLMEFDTRRHKFSQAVDSNGKEITNLRIRLLFKDSAENLWVGGENGLQIYAVGSDGLRLVENAAAKSSSQMYYINSIRENSQRMVWIASNNGLWCYNPIVNTMRCLTTDDGLPSNVIKGIEEDSNGRLWLSTGNGLSCYNPYTGSFRNYTTADGLPSNQFNNTSHCYSSREGVMYFGGLNGITAFVPEKLQDNPYSPAPIISSLRLFDRTVTTGDDSGILSQSISHTQRVDFDHDQNSFSFHFTVPNYLSGRHNSFSYKLEGYDKEWSQASDRRSATYSNLPHGNYTFRVMAANNDGVWCNQEVSVEVCIHPAWWQTWWAKVGLLLMIAGVALLLFKFLLERKTMENKLRLEQQESAHREELHQMKMRFFINISHEFRAPLTLIINPLGEMIGRAGDSWMRKQLKYVERNAKRLLHLINQLMDYRRAELGVFKLHITNVDVHRSVSEIFSYYQTLAQQKKIKYTLDASQVQGRRLLTDEQYLELITNNLLSNAFKYTPSGAISVSVKEQDDELLLSVSDTGIGIAEELQDRIFERFYQVGSNHIGSGVGLSLVQRLVELHHGRIELHSSLGEGSTFVVALPQNPEAYTPAELDSSGDTQTHKPHTSNTPDMYMLDGQIVDEEEKEEQPTGRHGTIVVAEDDDQIREYLRNGLGRNFITLEARNGEEALALLADNEVDLVITDAMMPVMDGLKLCTQIKQNINTGHIPVIVISACAEQQDQMRALEAGADDYLVKPFAMPVLEAKVKNTLRTFHRAHSKATGSLAIVPKELCFNALDEQILSKAIEVVKTNIDNPKFSTDEFARAMHMSRSNLHLKLKALSGESALEFIHKVRFQEACRLLKDGRWSVSEISDKVGFSTPSYFATSFKKYMGCLPTEYLSRHKE